MPEIIQDLIIHGGKVVLVVSVLLGVVAYLVLAERRFAGFIQDRLGPNRVGWFGFLQPLADLGKFIFKEDLTPGHVNKFFYALAPILTMAPAVIAFAVVPFGIPMPWKVFDQDVTMCLADLDIGILFVFAISSIGVYGLTLGGWASNSKYALIGGIRAAAQMVSYEIVLGLAVIGVFIFAGTLNLTGIIMDQAEHGWNILPHRQFFGFLLFFIAIFAETNRLPFDLPEAETELASGFHTEYSAMKFALFFLGEYAAMVVGSALTVTLFLGGWLVPFVDIDPAAPTVFTWILSIVSFSVKTGALLFIFIWVRWTLPRFRYDQLMRLGWQVMLPLALLNIVLTGILKVVF
jgi:NADH-quinone oxidoreductase subunit H